MREIQSDSLEYVRYSTKRCQKEMAGLGTYIDTCLQLYDIKNYRLQSVFLDLWMTAMVAHRY